MRRPRKKPAKIPNALLKRYDRSVRRARPLHPAEGESGPVRVYLQNGKPVNETLPAREKRFSRTFYRRVKPVIKVKKAGAALTVTRPERGQ
jgi:hypothetical protein